MEKIFQSVFICLFILGLGCAKFESQSRTGVSTTVLQSVPHRGSVGTEPTLDMGAVVYNCTDGNSIEIDGVQLPCQLSNGTPYVKPQVYINLKGQNLSPQNGETVTARFMQYGNNGSSLKIEVPHDLTKFRIVNSNLISIEVPQGVQSGPLFIDIKYSSRGLTNREVAHVAGPIINGDGMGVGTDFSRKTALSGSVAALYGIFSAQTYKNQVEVSCSSNHLSTAEIIYSSQYQINFKIPDSLPQSDRCSVVVNTGSIKSHPVYFTPNKVDSYDQKLGVYHWYSDYSENIGSAQSNINSALTDAKKIGFQTLRLTLAGNIRCSSSNLYHYLPNPSRGCPHTSSLKELAQREDYVAAFSNSNFHTYLLTTYPIGSDGITPWSSNSQLTNRNYEDAQEIRDLAQHLSSQYPNKKFIILDWEGDNAVMGFLQSLNNDPETGTSWTPESVKNLFLRYTQWIENRADAVGSSNAHNVFIGTEFNYSWRGMLNQYVNVHTPNCNSVTFRESVLNTVLPRLKNKLDYISFSSWNIMGDIKYDPLFMGNLYCGQNRHGSTPSLSGYNIAHKVSLTIDYIKSHLPNTKLIFGEMGFGDHQFESGGNSIEGLTGSDGHKRAILRTVNAMITGGAEYVIFWQLYANAQTQDFGILDRYGNPKHQNKLFDVFALRFFSNTILERTISSANTTDGLNFYQWNWYLNKSIPMAPSPYDVGMSSTEASSSMSVDHWWQSIQNASTWRKNIQLDSDASLLDPVPGSPLQPEPEPLPEPAPEPTPQGPAPTIDQAGSGCDDRNCIWLIGKNLSRTTIIYTRDLNGNLLSTYSDNLGYSEMSDGRIALSLRLKTNNEISIFGGGLQIVVENEDGQQSAPFTLRR